MVSYIARVAARAQEYEQRGRWYALGDAARGDSPDPLVRLPRAAALAAAVRDIQYAYPSLARHDAADCHTAVAAALAAAARPMLPEARDVPFVGYYLVWTDADYPTRQAAVAAARAEMADDALDTPSADSTTRDRWYGWNTYPCCEEGHATYDAAWEHAHECASAACPVGVEAMPDGDYGVWDASRGRPM